MGDSLQRRLRAHVVRLAAEIGERNVWVPGSLDAAAALIRRELESCGYAVREQTYEAAGQRCSNLEAVLPGRLEQAPGVVVGAHYDTVPGSPGANDNASGVAGLIEIARALRGARARNTLRLLAFVNEEPPFFATRGMGSHVYAQSARERRERIRMMLSLEMLGCYIDAPGSQRYPPPLSFFYPSRGNFIAFVSNLRSRRALRDLVNAFKSHSDFPAESLASPAIVPGVSWSDQRSFWRAGYPAVMVTDTAFYRYRYYHTPLDTPDRLSYVEMARVVDGLAHAIRALIGAPVRPGDA